ncbi:hypothetical protein PHLGIDRAFT_200072 [Phlebiopsis gigantea 11061_1 CR5-6]|uniref:Uncharacterized protein n=1 Tax=Phlebiopsis gigantea (strain 11061_1 CR5-6) TaxID=745531 RepID=A0A0C3PFH8_PHLG1|nr:hypothetical protein PHLGIDRAFT_200072 [Phlebiopsis gigantea 11061_1 CR5-6]
MAGSEMGGGSAGESVGRCLRRIRNLLQQDGLPLALAADPRIHKQRPAPPSRPIVCSPSRPSPSTASHARHCPRLARHPPRRGPLARRAPRRRARPAPLPTAACTSAVTHNAPQCCHCGWRGDHAPNCPFR